MADISLNLTVERWLRSKASNLIDLTDDFIYSTMYDRGIEDDTALMSEITEKQRDLCLADIYWNAAISSVKSGTQGEADGGWSHYIAIKNVANRDQLKKMAKALYDKWGEDVSLLADPRITLKQLY